MNQLTTLDRVTAVHTLVESGEAQRRRERHGPRAAAARDLGIDAVTLFRWEKGISTPVGSRLRLYYDYLIGLGS